MTMNFIVLITVTAVLVVTGGCASTPADNPPSSVELFGPQEIGKWHITPDYENSKPWKFEDGAYEGFESWTAYPGVYDDFVLEVDILFSGKEEGGIVVRGDQNSKEPWKSGYELDIDWAPDRKHGHIHFPVKSKPYRGEALIVVNKWHTVKIRAQGQVVTVFLDGKEMLQFTDDEFHRGNICLEGRTDGVKYRNLRVAPLK